MKNNKENKPKVSIILPVYNGENYVDNCLKSILKQTLNEIEVICMDDGSVDNTGMILDEIAAQDERVQVFHKENTGYGNTMNLGISKARGEYIGIVESDDYIEPNMCQELYTIAKSNRLDVIKSNFSRFYGEGLTKEIELVPITNDESYYGRVICPKNELFVFNMNMNTVTGLYRREFLVDNDIQYNETPGAAFQDNGFWIKTYLLAERLQFVNEYYYRCRRDNPNSSVKLTDKAFVVVKEFDLIHDWLVANDELYKLFIEKFIYLQCIGYFSVYNRSNIEHKLKFVFYFSKRYNKYAEEGLINTDYYGPIVFRKLNQIMSNPVSFFVDDCVNAGKKFNEWKNELLQESQYKYFECLAQLKATEKELQLLRISEMRLRQNEINEIHEQRIKSQKPKISVIVPVFNVERYIDDTLRSIRGQSLENIEIICVDDGSVDSTYEKIIHTAKYDDRFLIYTQENQGSGIARNYALEKACGEYVVFMDGDDFYPDEQTLEYLYKKTQETECKICGGSCMAYSGGEIIEGPKYYLFQDEQEWDYKEYQLAYGYTRYIYKREFLIENKIFFPTYRRFQDPPFFVKAMIKAKKFYAFERPVYVYRKQHKQVKWDSEKCMDVLNGCRDILIMSQEARLELLWQSIVDKINVEYNAIILSEIRKGNRDILEKFVEIVMLVNNHHEGKNDTITSWCQVFDFLEREYRREEKRVLQKDNEKISKIEKCHKDELVKINDIRNENERIIADLNFQIYSIRNSITYKVGRFITFIPRKVRELCGWTP